VFAAKMLASACSAARIYDRKIRFLSVSPETGVFIAQNVSFLFA